MNDINPVELDWRDRHGIAATRRLIVAAFADPLHYAERRIAGELRPLPAPHYRQFFVAWGDGRLVGAGGIRAADWASDTHLLYLSAVDADYRGRGIGRALLAARIAWIREHHAHGRILVSTRKEKRYRDAGFRPVGRQKGEAAQLMLLEF